MKHLLSFTVILLMVLSALSTSTAQTISLQGLLTDSSGDLLSDGNYSIDFKIYNVNTGGIAVWTETQTVAVEDGLFNVGLGSVNILNVDFDTQYWVGISIEGDSELSPRIKLTYSPYSMYAVAIADNSVNSNKIENGTIAGDDISQMGAAAGQSLIWNGTNWSPDNEADPTWNGSNDSTGNIYRSGYVGIGTDSPTALLHTSGTGTGEGNVLFSGEFKSSNPGDPPVEGAGTRMMWYPDKSAFRVGGVTGSQWDKTNIGISSLASGLNTIASGNYSTAMGNGTSALGFYSFAIGAATTASGSRSIAMGQSTEAKSSYETVVGRWNSDYTPNDTVGWNSSDRLFVVGNGSDYENRSNALTILKNGNTGLGTDTPSALLHTSGTGTGEGNVLFSGERKTISPGNPPAEGAGTRMMWYPDKAAFRAGYVTGTQWDKDNIGIYSFASGYNTTASGTYSAAMGYNTKALGDYSTAMGRSTRASGDYSTAMGYSTIANGTYSTTMGYFTSASGTYSAAMGYSTKASGDYSTAMGVVTNAIGTYSTAIGWYTTASGGFSTAMGRSTTASAISSTAMGSLTTASGWYSTAMGENTTAKSGFETVIGRWNTDYTSNSTYEWDSADRLFVIGNGTGSDARSNALTILKNGNIGIGTDTPNALLHTNGTGTGEGNVLFSGEFKSSNPGDPPVEGAGTRMMWYPDKSAFRVGFVTGTQWDKDNIGNSSIVLGSNSKATDFGSIALGGLNTASGLGSTAIGFETTASGDYSTAMGLGSTASGTETTAIGNSSSAIGDYSTALGDNTTASGDYSTAMGNYTTASGYYSTAIGFETTALGYYSTALGANTESESGFETVVGRWNEDYTPNSTAGWDTNDRLFVVGNGTSSGARSNAMTILKNGRVGLQTVTSPTFALELPNSSSDGIGKGRANAWTTYSDGRIKSAIKQISYGLAEILQIEPLSYFQHNSELYSGKLELSNDGSNSIGFIAQDLYKILPELITKPENENTDLWSVSYDKLTPVLVKAVQEQQEIIDEQNEKIDNYEERISNLENIVQQLLNTNKATK